MYKVKIKVYRLLPLVDHLHIKSIKNEKFYSFITYFISRFVPIEYIIQVLEQKDIASLQGSTTLICSKRP